jgi:isoquinoline 1-oxidoreductase subunit beta
VRLVSVDSDPKWGTMVTGGSRSVWQTYPVFSRAGAAGRIALIEAGAALLGVSPDASVARKGRVEAGGRSIGYGEIVQRGHLARRFSADDLKALTIKTPDKWTLIGRSTDALDIPDKTRGEAVYGIDAEVEGMVYARPKLPPTRYGSTVLSIDDASARSVKGYLRSIAIDDPSGTVPGWVMVIAKTYPAAIRATELVQVKWRSGETAAVSDQDLRDHAHTLIADKTAGAILDTGGGDVEATLAGAATRVEATYTTAGVLHFQLEPVNALAFQKDGVFEIHTGNQAQSFILPTLAKALQVPPEKIVLRSYLIGGGFGRRLNGDYCVPAALTAKATPSSTPFDRRACRRCGWVSTLSARRSPWITPQSRGGRCLRWCPRAWSKGRTAPSTIPFRSRARTIGTTWASSKFGRSTTTSPRRAFGRAGSGPSRPGGPTGPSNLSWTRPPTRPGRTRWPSAWPG